MLGIGKTHRGMLRENNEDSFFISNEAIGPLPNLYIVADGMGGHNAGEVASSLAVKYCCDYLTDPSLEKGEILDCLTGAVVKANNQVYLASRSDEECYNMGTTFTGCCLSEGKAYIVHVGDSRLYRVNEYGMEQLTQDHSYVAEMVRAGRISPEEAETHPDRNIITRAVGINRLVTVDGLICELEKGDYLLICSDGLNTMLTDDKIFRILSGQTDTYEEKLDRLIEAANEAGGKDNITVIIIYNKEGDRS